MRINYDGRYVKHFQSFSILCITISTQSKQSFHSTMQAQLQHASHTHEQHMA